MEKLRLTVIVLFLLLLFGLLSLAKYEDERQQVKKMFYHAYDNYIEKAFPYDELRPLTCDGVDTWGSYSLTLVDALDTLFVLGNHSEFRRVANYLVDNLDFEINLNVSVFESNIRVVGGLLSAHLLSRQAGMKVEPNWPCNGPLLRLAVKLARKLLPAFDTPTGMPYGTINLKHGVDPKETPITCTAGVGTYLVEFGTLSRLTGDPSFEQAALRAVESLVNSKSPIGLLGNHIDVVSGKWHATDSGVGAGVDSYFEYLVKGAILLDNPDLMRFFEDYLEPINNYIKNGDWYFWVQMKSGAVTMPIHQSLEAFWPGLQTLYGDVESAYKTILNYYSVWKRYGGTPEFFSVSHELPISKREGYPLRPELIESTLYLYRATNDSLFIEFGRDALHAIEAISKTDCGYATVKDVLDHTLDNRMESFFLAETVKYLYLLFDPTNPLLSTLKGVRVRRLSDGRRCALGGGGFIFNTEAHPIDVSALRCCDVTLQTRETSRIDQLLRDFDIKTLTGEAIVKPESEGELRDPALRDYCPGNRTRRGANLICSGLPFHMRLTKYGQIFVDD